MKTINITTAQLHEIHDIVNSIDTSNLLISAHSIAHCYERATLDEGDIYALMRDVLSVTTTIDILKDTIKV